MSIAILVPVLGRPQNVEPTMKTFGDTVHEEHRLLFIASESDTAELAELERAGADHVVIEDIGYPPKINHGARITPEFDWLFLGADDVVCHDGWLEKAYDVHVSTGAPVIGTNDLGNNRVKYGIHSTHTLVKRSYIDEIGGVWDEGPGSVLCQQYEHEWVDDEFIQTAMARKLPDGSPMFAPSLDSIVEHMHYLWKKADDDDTYRRGRRNSVSGRALYERRRRMWMVPR